MEDEIAKILESIENDNENLQPLNLVVDCKNKIINNCYKKYLNFKINVQNLKDTLEILDHYEFIENVDELKPGDRFRYLSKRYFNDIKVSELVSFINLNTGIINFRNGIFANSVKNNVLLFKYIPEDKLIKMKLIEIIQS